MVPNWFKEKAKPLKSRVSSAVEQRFCKPLVGSSILSPGTNKIRHFSEFWLSILVAPCRSRSHYISMSYSGKSVRHRRDNPGDSAVSRKAAKRAAAEAGRDGGPDRRREQHGHPLYLALVPHRDRMVGVLKDLFLGCAARCRLFSAASRRRSSISHLLNPMAGSSSNELNCHVALHTKADVRLRLNFGRFVLLRDIAGSI